MTPEPADQLAALADRLGHRFADLALLRHALSHRSWCAEHPGTSSNERLEFLGDAVLGWLVADLVYQRFADQGEGRLTEVRKGVVNATALAEVAAVLRIGDALLLGKGEAAGGGGSKPSILSDALEAVLGAIYLDGGAEAARTFVTTWILPRIDAVAAGSGYIDHKTLLQELTSRMFESAPVYLLTERGPDHAKVFNARVIVADVERGHGEGRSKKLAEQSAAREALAALGALDA